MDSQRSFSFRLRVMWVLELIWWILQGEKGWSAMRIGLYIRELAGFMGANGLTKCTVVQHSCNKVDLLDSFIQALRARLRVLKSLCYYCFTYRSYKSCAYFKCIRFLIYVDKIYVSGFGVFNYLFSFVKFKMENAITTCLTILQTRN